MSRVAKAPVVIPAGVEVKLEGQVLTVKGKSAALTLNVNPAVKVTFEDNELKFAPVDESKNANAQSGTARALAHNMVVGVTKGYVVKLILKGVGYRAQAKGNTVTLNLGYSNPVDYTVPEGIKVLNEQRGPLKINIVYKGKTYEVDASYVLTTDGKLFCNVKLYKNGNKHIKFCKEFMQKLNVGSTARASLYIYNSRKEVETFVEKISHVREWMGIKD